MKCSRCGTANPANHGFCSSCGHSLRADGSLATKAGGSATTAAKPAIDADMTVGGIILPPVPQAEIGTLTPPGGSPPPSMHGNADTTGPWAIGRSGKSADEVDFGPRYRLGRMLGEGGMGAVYKAYDKELDRTVALKLVRPGLADNPMAVQRFKQELLLASKISHRNVLRIHDLGEFGGTRFISMAFIEGEDLHHLISRLGKLPLTRALNIARQLCAGLDAAHSEGVVHRDFKPQNILLDGEDHAYISDFGLSKSFASDVTGMTRSGEMLGTPRYMAPEQVEGGKIDNRADLYALGLILYEMMTGEVPFQAESTVQIIYKHVHEQPRDPRQMNPEVPEWLARVILKCLEKDPEARYANAREVLEAINTATAPPPSKARKRSRTQLRPTLTQEPAGILAYWKYAAVALLIVALSVGAWIWKGRRTPAHAPSKPVTVLVADFTNRTGDPIFDGTLEPIFNVALEGASFISSFNRGDARKAATKLPTPSSKLDEQTARLVAVNLGAAVVVSGSLESQGGGYELSIKASRAITGETVINDKVQAVNKDQVLFAATKAAAAVRRALGDMTSESEQLFGMETLTASSLEAAHEYSAGMEALSRGNNDEALQSFSKAADLDSAFGLAYAGKAIAARNVGSDDDAVAYVKQAISHIDRMTERERYRTRAIFYMLTHNYQKCVEEFGALVSRYPSDASAHNNLGVCYSRLRDIPKAMAEMRRVTEILPKGIPYKVNLAFYEALTGDFQTAEQETKAAIAIEPKYGKSYLVLALAQMGNGEVQDAGLTYNELAKVSPVAASVAATGLADIAVYEGRFTDAAKILEDAASADLKAKRLERVADKFAALAYSELLRDHRGPAQVAAEKALANNKAGKYRFIAGIVFAQTGATAKARELAANLGAELGAEPQAYAKLIEGEIALKNGDARAAVNAFTDANNFLDTWLGHLALARAYLQAGAFTEADSELDRCIKRRGEALLLFMDTDVPTYSYFPVVYYYQGRVREGLKISNFAEPYRKYLSIRDKAGEDPLLPEVRRRAGNPQ